MGMSLLDETFEVYVQMRSSGKEAKAALEALRARIETLLPNERMEMVRRVKAWESGARGAALKQQERPPREIVKQPSNEQTVICPRCGGLNSINDVFCVRCGNFLKHDASPHETTKLDDTGRLSRGADYFGPIRCWCWWWSATISATASSRSSTNTKP